METSESEYPLPPGKKLNYEGSWRPEDKAIESAEQEAVSEHPESSKSAEDSRKVEPGLEDQDS